MMDSQKQNNNMVELGVTDGDVLQVELRLCVHEPSFTAFWPENRKLHQGDIEMTSRDGKLVCNINGQT